MATVCQNVSRYFLQSRSVGVFFVQSRFVRSLKQQEVKKVVVVSPKDFLRNIDEKVIKQPPKETHRANEAQSKSKKPSEAICVQKYHSFLKRVSKVANLAEPISKKCTYYSYKIAEQYRCQDTITGLSSLEGVSGMKDEHREIGLVFQNMMADCAQWKQLKIKSNKATDQICIVATFNDTDSSGKAEEARQKLLENMAHKCTSLYMITIRASEIKRRRIVAVEKLSGRDYLEEVIGFFKFKLGPFAQMPVNPEGVIDLFRNLQSSCIQPSDVVIDYDCNAGIHGINMANSKTFTNQLMCFDASSANLDNTSLNAQDKGLSLPDIRLGATAKDVELGLVDIHFENRKAVVLLHPQQGSAIPEPVIRALKRSHVVRSIIYFTSNPEEQALSNLVELLKPDSKRDPYQCYRLKRCHILDLYPKTPNFEHAFALENRQLRE